MLLFQHFRRGSAEPALAANQQPAAYAGYPGAALLAHRGGPILGLNDRGKVLARLLDDKAVPELARTIEESLAERAVRVRSMGMASPLESDGNGASTIEVTVLPQPNGESALVLGRDVTLERNLREALAESRQRYKDLVDISSDFAWETGPDGTFVFVSPRGALGWTAGALVGQPASDFLVKQPGIPS